MRAILTLLLCIFSTLASAQVFESTTHAVQTSFLLRMQRQETTSASCVLVYPDHRAHYEIVTSTGTQVYEGALTPANADQFDALLKSLGTIDPAQITHKSHIDELDIVLINLMTQRGVLNLHFSDPSTRKPFKAALDPALKWMGSARKGLPSMPDSKKNNCTPQSGDAPPPKTEPPLMSARQAEALSHYLLFRANTFRTDEGYIDESCVAVTPDGRYRYETQSLDRDGVVTKAKVFGGTIDSDEMAKLRKILAEPAFANSTHYPEPPNGVAARNSEIVEFEIPREDRLQRLRFFSNSGLGYIDPAAAAQMTITDTDAKLLKPIRAWMKDSVEKRKSEIGDTKPTRCSGPF